MHKQFSPPSTASHWHSIDDCFGSKFGSCPSTIANSEEPLDPVDIQVIVLALHWLFEKLRGSDFPGLSWDKWDTLCEAFENQATQDVEGSSRAIQGKLMPVPDSSLRGQSSPKTFSGARSWVLMHRILWFSRESHVIR